MSLTFIDIEKQKSWRIGFFFVILLLMYFVSVLVIILFTFGDIFAKDLVSVVFTSLYIFIIAAVLAFVHFYLLSYSAAQGIKEKLGAVAPDLEDELHKRLRNIVQEIHVATGNKRKMAIAVLPTHAMNALAVDDIKGNALIVITEGLVSRLSRDQTQAVIAHEAYHILSGDCRESTLAVSIFGFYMPFIEKIMIVGRAYIFSFILLKRDMDRSFEGIFYGVVNQVGEELLKTHLIPYDHHILEGIHNKGNIFLFRKCLEKIPDVLNEQV